MERPSRRAASHAPHGPEAIARGLPAHQGMGQGPPSPQRPAFRRRLEPAVTGSLQLLRAAGQLEVVVPLLRLGDGMLIQVVESAWRKAQQLHAHGVLQGGQTPWSRLPTHHGAETAACGVCITQSLARKRVQPRNRMRENRTSGTVRGAPGNGRSYREMLKTDDSKFPNLKKL